MALTQPEQRVRTGARRVRSARAVPMKAAAIIAALGIALIVTMGPSPAAAQTIVIRECGDDYVVTRYNADGSVKGVWNKQLSAQGTIYTAGKTWKLVEGDNGQPDRFVSAGGALQVFPCDTTRGSVRQVQTSTTLVSNVGRPGLPGGAAVTLLHDIALSFTTGVQYTTLTGVHMDMRTIVADQHPSFVVEIWSGDSIPTTKVGSLGSRNSLTYSLSAFTTEEFAASGNGINLAANTKYWVVIDLSKGSGAGHVTGTTSTGEDSGAAAGWSIGNQRRTRIVDTWATLGQPYPFKINVVGHAFMPDNFDCNAYLGWEHTNGRQWDSADRVWRQVGSYFFTGQYADTLAPICELRFSSVGPGTLSEKLGYGYTLCSQAPTWQTVDPETGEAVGGPAEKHYTGHKTSSGQDICSDFDGLRSTKKYRQEQHLKQLCSREPMHALCN